MSDSAGKRLKAERLQRGLSVEDITDATKMRPSIIKALEADDYTQFPSITHARNFLSLYGKYLKVDVKDGVASLATPAKMGIENYQYLNAEGAERNDISSFRTSRRTLSHHQPRGGEPNSRSLLIGAGVIAFFIVATYLAINLQRLNLATGANSPSESANLEQASPTPFVLTPLPKKANPYSNPEPTLDDAPFYAPTLESRRLIKPRPWPRA